jgi:hypothetical protein
VISRLIDYTGGESQTSYDSVTNYNNFYELAPIKLILLKMQTLYDPVRGRLQLKVRWQVRKW